jgi:peptidoglycan L-alanyl-D-glutamate endopeptidase CwlK
MDLISIERILESHPDIRQQLKADYIEANNKLGSKYVRLRFSYVYRSPKLQHEIFLQRPKVTNADAWQSIHQYGLAFDIVLLLDKDKNGTFEEITYDMVKDFDLDKTPDWKEVTQYFLSKGYTNGFISNGKKWDYPHFQKDFGYSWRQLKAKIDAKDVIVDPNGITYPRL